ncbi:CHAT domain-containing protein [Fulvivirga ulvae]|uniref:CHAT domain-containing protein n=1 Tax=Fulvivirga ulvae TaxID=2904245 RepID=UPI001F22576F|nr:CHAT domain-containing protein [Fulvivirga ulvae]UII33184.1 CHAT domain-containing protein [Fulvivirga ulvae]
MTGFSGPVAAKQPFQQRIEALIKQDSLDAFIYTYLDEFLKDPVYERLYLFDEASNKQWREPRSAHEYLASTIFLCNKGYYNLRFSQVDEAVSAYESAWSYDQQFDFSDFDIIEYCLKPLGNAYSMLGDYASAENTIKSYLLEAQKRGLKDQQTSALINLSIVYHDTGKNKEAIEVLNTAQENNSGRSGLIYSNLAKNYLTLGEYNIAQRYAMKAAEVIEAETPNQAGYLGNIYNILSSIRLKARDTVEALNFLRKSRSLMEADPMVKSREYAKVIVQEASVLYAMGNSEASIKIYRQALRQLIPLLGEGQLLPSEDMLYAENTLKEVFDGMAAAFVSLDSLDQAINCYKKSFTVEERLKETYTYDDSKYLQQGENRWRAEQVLDLCYRLFSLSKDSRYVQEAFIVAERTKSVALRDRLYNRKALEKFAGDSVLIRRQRLARGKAQVEAALAQEQLKGRKADLRTIEHLMDRKNRLAMSLKGLDKGMSRLTRESHRDIDLDSLQQKIKDDKLTLVEYFFGAEALYTFALNGSSITMYKNKQIKQVKKIVGQYTALFTDEVKINAAPDVFAELSQTLFGILFPARVNNTLLIVPDGLLNFVPFEALLTAKPPSADYSQWPWLINSNPVFYQYSGTLYLHDFGQDRFADDKVLGFFPRFADSERFLKYSKNELEGIRKHFDGNFLSDEKATKQAFFNHASDYSIIHLSTHAKPGGLYEPPSVAFVDSALHLPEVLGLNLHTQLLVLGACETGIGKLYKGEGPLSLASGFSHAGVKNIVLSLWEVNDLSTSWLMTDFYKSYEEQPKAHMALHQAKLAYLQNDEIAMDKKSPYYWASFVYYGQSEAKDAVRASGYGMHMIFVAVALIVMVLYLYYRRR